MKDYQHILLALDLHPENDVSTKERALEIRRDTGARLSVVHAVEHIANYGAAFAYPALADLQSHLVEEAHKQLALCASDLDVSEDDRYIEIGSPKPVIIDIASRIRADLIIVGSHSRHGFHLLFGSLADAIVHEAPCDVLAVRLQD